MTPRELYKKQHSAIRRRLNAGGEVFKEPVPLHILVWNAAADAVLATGRKPAAEFHGELQFPAAYLPKSKQPGK